ncbi:phosphoribosyltransferase family protein [Actinoplanes sp. NPDC023714]|uniref:phosphoribosyltransferase n=1 Tax=Actinoplanes sp. NPDC023714 TaxID=3154322 RepID=UPI0033D13A0A
MFRDRREAGRLLGHVLADLRGSDAVVLGLPRGGVVVAFEVARLLDLPLEVIVVRKVGVPWQPEVAMGAVGEDGATIVNQGLLDSSRIDPQVVAATQAHAWVELEHRVKALRGDRPRIALHARTAVVVDDGIATGATARVACRVARALGAGKVIVAVPVAPQEATGAFAEVADRVVCLRQPTDFGAVGRFYKDFRPVSDDQVVHLLDVARRNPCRG